MTVCEANQVEGGGGNLQKEAWGRGERTFYQTLQHLCGFFLCFLMFPACVPLPPVCAILQIKSWMIFSG